MSVRKRTWTKGGEQREAWVVDYADAAGVRRQKTFERKKDATAFQAKAKVEIGEGVHVADSATVSVAEAGALWLQSCAGRGLERATIDSYRQALRYHIEPLIGRLKLSQVTAPVVRQFEDRLRAGEPDGKPRSPAMVRKVRSALSIMLGDSMERGLVSRNVARELRARRTGGADRKQEKRQKGKLQPGVDIPLPSEIAGISDLSTRGLVPTCIAAGVVTDEGGAKYTGLHSLRHFFASWLINRKADGGLELPLKVVQERMGHSSITITADRYGHLFPRGDDHDELAEAESRLWST